MLKNTLMIIGIINSTEKIISAGIIYQTESFWRLLIFCKHLVSSALSKALHCKGKAKEMGEPEIRPLLQCGAAGKSPSNAAVFFVRIPSSAGRLKRYSQSKPS